jgi:hypothetical protein
VLERLLGDLPERSIARGLDDEAAATLVIRG